MREIKFKFYYNNQYQGTRELNRGSIIDMPWPWDEVAQYTGLKDKNGVEIYEGDIVKVERNDSFSSYDQAVVVFGLGSFLLEYTKKAPKGSILINEAKIKSDDETVYGYCTDWNIRVIGNIYENPELLTT